MRRRNRRSPRPSSPLPLRNGVAAVRVHLPYPPPDVQWPTLRDHLITRYARALTPDDLDAMFAAEAFVGLDGPLAPDTPYVPCTYVWYHRDPAPEIPVPYQVEVVYRDEHIVVADKPHFLATIPRGRHIVQTALSRLREELDLPDLIPAHRLDRLTAGLVLFVIRPEDRGDYQLLFQNRAVHKEYEAIAPYVPELADTLPRTVRSRIEKVRGRMDAVEVPGEPNAETRIELTEHHAGLGRYRLLPATGQTHQLRVHMNSLGLPLLNDPLYPVVADYRPDDFTNPLQLLAKSLRFTDPVTGAERSFTSSRTLEAAALFTSADPA